MVRFASAIILPPDTITTVINPEQEPPSHPLTAFVGSYTHSGFGTIAIRYENNTLYAELPFTKLRLEHQSGNVFIDHLVEETPLTYWPFLDFDFKTDEAGNVSGLEMNFENPEVFFERVK